MINLRELEVFRAVMSSGTTVGAARALNLSQPSVQGAEVRLTRFCA